LPKEPLFCADLDLKVLMKMAAPRDGMVSAIWTLLDLNLLKVYVKAPAPGTRELKLGSNVMYILERTTLWLLLTLSPHFGMAFTQVTTSSS